MCCRWATDGVEYTQHRQASGQGGFAGAMESSAPALFGVLDAARAKGVHEETVRRAIRAGRLSAFRACGRFVVRAADLDAWQPAHEKAPQSRWSGLSQASPAHTPDRQQDEGNNAPPAPGRGDLPVPLSSFVGRERAIAEVRQLLETVRLVTLTGAGGVGKTRLAIEVASGLAGPFADGVCFVDLAALMDGALVPQAVAGALGVRAVARRPLVEAPVDALRPKQLLLLLDNCE